MTYPSNTSETAGEPTQCPVCRSNEISTATKVARADSYWRCGKCGEVWNAARTRVAARYVGYRPFGR